MGLGTQRSADLAAAVAHELGLQPDAIGEVRTGALLHDVGKVSIPDHVLLKRERLNAEEWELVRRYPARGAEILAAVPELRGVAPIIRHHGEHWDGSGYPDGLTGAAIPLGSRIVAVAVAYDVMTTEQAYSPALGHAEAVSELTRCAGTQFDPDVVEAFCRATAGANP